MKLAILVACYNRVNVTLRGLQSVYEGFSNVPNLDLHIFLVDDASPDNTGKIVKERYPSIHLIMGTGQLYWNGGMCKAFLAAQTYGRFDAYLLYNDDVEIMPSVVSRFVDEFVRQNRDQPCILAGATISSITNMISYGGFRQLSEYHALSFSRVPITGKTESIDTFNGNFVLIPGAFFEKIGGPDPVYVQDFADIDLGLVAKRHGISAKVWGQPIGYCEPDDRPPKKIGNWFRRLQASFVGTSSLREYLHFVVKNRPLWLLPVYAAKSVVERVFRSFKSSN